MTGGVGPQLRAVVRGGLHGGVPQGYFWAWGGAGARYSGAGGARRAVWGDFQPLQQNLGRN